jgi:hypothetical protein
MAKPTVRSLTSCIPTISNDGKTLNVHGFRVDGIIKRFDAREVEASGCPLDLYFECKIIAQTAIDHYYMQHVEGEEGALSGEECLSVQYRSLARMTFMFLDENSEIEISHADDIAETFEIFLGLFKAKSNDIDHARIFVERLINPWNRLSTMMAHTFDTGRLLLSIRGP